MGRQAAEGLNSACDLDLLRVVTTDGRHLGHVFDLRCDWRPGQDHAPVVDELVYGRVGLAERLGLTHRKPQSIPWSAVERIEGKVVVVSADRVPRPRDRR
jgi:sporulation protein YlmC with PRC-barrel domain